MEVSDQLHGPGFIRLYISLTL